MSYKGIYKPSYPKKYKGDQRNIIYRSLWERKFMNYCDLNEAKWKAAREFCADRKLEFKIMTEKELGIR